MIIPPARKLKARTFVTFFLSLSYPSVCSEDMIGEMIVPPARKLEDLIRLADLCVDLLRQNEEFYAEVGSLWWH